MKRILLIVLIGIFFVAIASADTQGLTMKFIVPSTEPEWDNLRNFITYINENFSESITASSSIGINCYYLNDTTKFDVDCNGLITNNTALSSVETIYLNITVNNTLGEEISGEFYIDIRSTITSAICRYKKYGYYNIEIPFMKEVDCY